MVEHLKEAVTAYRNKDLLLLITALKNQTKLADLCTSFPLKNIFSLFQDNCKVLAP